MATVYFDMDGVLTQIYEDIAAYVGVSLQFLYEDKERTHEIYMEWAESRGWEAAFSRITPNHLPQMRDLMRRIHKRNHRIEILTSLGLGDPPDLDRAPMIYSGKVRFMKAHYGDFFLEPSIISQFQTVARGRYKAKFADSQSVLLDDSSSVRERFSVAGGHAVRYLRNDHEECVANLMKVLEELECVE